MTAAHDSAMAQLGIAPGHPLTGKLAANLAALADEGDPIKLCELALAKLRAKT